MTLWKTTAWRCTMVLATVLILSTPTLAVPTAVTYRVTYEGSSASNFEELFKEADATPAGQIPKGAQNISTQMTAKLIEVPLGPDGERTEYRVKNPEILVAVNGQAAEDYIQELTEGLKSPVVAQKDARGRVVGVSFPKDIKESGVAVWSLLLAYQQFAASPNLSDAQEVIEEDANGRYRAQYVSSAQLGIPSVAGMELIGKTKLEYLPEPFKWIPGEGASDKLVKTNHNEMWLFDNGQMRSMQGSGELFISVAGKALAYAKGQVELIATDRVPVSPARLRESRAYDQALQKTGRTQALWVPEISDDHKAQMYAQDLKGRTLKQLLDTVLAADKDERERRAQRTPMYLGFQALAYLYPEELKALKPAFRGLDPEGMPYRVIVAALAQIGNAESQAFLRWLYPRHKDNEEHRVSIISSLSDVRHPAPESVALLTTIANSRKDSLERHAAELGLGTMALMLRGDQPARARAINDRLVNALAKTKDGDRAVELLRAIGNSGGLETFSAVQPFLQAEDLPIRRQAVSALRWNESERAESVLLGAMTTDPDESVRKAAIEAFQVRPMTEAAKGVHKQVAVKDEEPGLRLGALGNLLRMQYRHPDIIPFVRGRMTTDPDQETREKIEELLSTED